MREYEIGSEAWERDRIDRGLDPSEGDRPDDDPLLRFELDPTGLRLGGLPEYESHAF